MEPKRVLVIGGGPGGYVAAIRAAQLGAKVILIEKDKIGGTCLNRGCIPTKALLYDTKRLHSMRRSTVFQSLIPKGFDPLQSMMERKKKVVQELAKGVEMLLESHRVNVKYGQADLLGPKEVVFFNGEVKETIEADAIILAPGSKSKTLPHIPLDGERIITSDEALEIQQVPTDIIIMGGGYIGVELATFFNTLGSKVTILEILGNILPGVERELARNLRRFLEKDGIKILTQSTVKDIQYQGERLKLTLETPEGVQMIAVEKLLLAIGRVPNLNLDFLKAGVEISPNGIRVNRRLETTAPHVYGIGDAKGGLQLAHVAMEDGVLAAENAMGLDRQLDDHPIPLCIFTYPEIASIGLTEDEAKERGEIKVGRFPFRSNSRAVISGETEGLIKVIVSRETDEVLGVHVVGLDASDLISTASSIIRYGVKSKDFSRLIQAHPTVSEAMKEAFLDVAGMAIHLPRPLREQKK